MKTITFSLLCLALTSCTANPTKTPAPDNANKTSDQTQEISPVQAVNRCICVKMWLPVCGVNNKTYGNSCEADCAGVKYTQGACEAKK